MAPPSRPSTKAIEEHFGRRAEIRALAQSNPAIPERLSQIVRWVETHMRAAGLRLAVEEVEAATRANDWQRRFALTPAEARLAAHLLEGGTTASYIAERRLSPHTVRNQLRSIYAKTNTNRQVSLLQLLLRASGKNP